MPALIQTSWHKMAELMVMFLPLLNMFNERDYDLSNTFLYVSIPFMSVGCGAFCLLPLFRLLPFAFALKTMCHILQCFASVRLVLEGTALTAAQLWGWGRERVNHLIILIFAMVMQ